jgi:predicted ATPase
LIEETGQYLFKPEASRIRALATRGDLEVERIVDAYFAEAIELARRSEMKLWELRATVSCAQFWRDLGRRGEAQRLLEPVYSWFTEGSDTPMLQDAKVLLDQLA